LNLSANQLTSFDGTGLTSLTYLEIQNSQLTSLNGFTFPESLTELNLSANQLTSLSGSTFPESLTDLYLENNQFTSFDGTGLSSLTYLNLDGNQLTSFDGTGLSSLTQLFLIGNQLDASDNDLILAQLDDNGVENGYFFGTYDANDETQALLRTSGSNSDYNSLISKGWAINQPA
jgi:Leucine-rich repeat (LRR) protein